LYGMEEISFSHQTSNDINEIKFISLSFNDEEIFADQNHENLASKISINQLLAETRKEAKPNKC